MSEWLRSRLMNERGSMLLGGLVFSDEITLLGLAIFDLNVVESRLASDRAAADVTGAIRRGRGPGRQPARNIRDPGSVIRVTQEEAAPGSLWRRESRRLCCGP